MRTQFLCPCRRVVCTLGCRRATCTCLCPREREMKSEAKRMDGARQVRRAQLTRLTLSQTGSPSPSNLRISSQPIPTSNQNGGPAAFQSAPSATGTQSTTQPQPTPCLNCVFRFSIASMTPSWDAIAFWSVVRGFIHLDEAERERDVMGDTS